MKTCRLILYFLCSFCIFSQAQGQTWQDNRISELEKITVGPWDNFAASIVKKDLGIYFTRDRNQISNIYYQALDSAEVSRYIGEQGDAKQAVLNPSNTTMAMTYYGDDAQGDICLVKLVNELMDKKIDCITSQHSVDQTPFWIDDFHLGFIRRVSGNLTWQLVEYNLKTKNINVLVTGYVSAPSASPDGAYILYSQNINGKAETKLFNRANNTSRTLMDFNLPGISGFFTFSQDGQFAYFNHYLNDTNGDQKIDGSDHSVVFRIPSARWFSATTTLLPEQLTSVNTNCKFPSLSEQYLYVTCAFEGSLDIYRLKLSGIVPIDWSQDKVWQAHLIARSYEQRLLLLNTLRYRFGLNEITLLERVLSNHLEIGELTAARYYTDELLQRYNLKNNSNMVEFYSSLSALIQVQSSKQRVPVNIVTSRFRQTVFDAKSSFSKIQGNAHLVALLNAQLAYELEDFTAAKNYLDSISFAQKLLPLERFLIFELYKKTLLPSQSETLLTLYPFMFNEASISAESRLYYAFSFLKLMNNLSYTPEERIKILQIEQAKTDFSNIIALLLTEEISLTLTIEKNKTQQLKILKKLRNHLNQHKKMPLLRKAMHTRAIYNLGQASQFKYMESVSRNWLLITNVKEMEFVYVAEQFSSITMNKAYGVMAAGKPQAAYPIFYSAIRQTNDLEAHYQFVTLGLRASLNKKENLKQSYELLKKKQLIGSNLPYVNALQLVIAAEAKPALDVKLLDEALGLLKNMRASGLSPAMRELLMGYIYHQKLRVSQKGYAFNKSFFQRAHHHYMMALDLAQDNARIAATVWENLGWLQFEVRQYGLAADFFKHRLTIPFVDKSSLVAVKWMLARTLFYNNQLQDALTEAEDTLSYVVDNQLGDVSAYREKTAFYAVQARAYEKAIEHYENLFGQGLFKGRNLAKGYLAYAYALMSVKRVSDAEKVLKKLLTLSHQLPATSKRKEQLIAFYPQRFQLLAYGFLAKLSQSPTEMIEYRRKRVKIFEDMAGKTADFAYDEVGRLSFIAKDYQHIAVVYEKIGQYSAMADAIHQSLRWADKWAVEAADEVGPVIYRTLLNYLSLNISYPTSFSPQLDKSRDKIFEKTLRGFEEHPYRSSLIVFQHSKLKVLRLALKNKQRKTPQESEKLQQWLLDTEMQQLFVESPKYYSEIEGLVKYFE